MGPPSTCWDPDVLRHFFNRVAAGALPKGAQPSALTVAAARLLDPHI